MSSPRFPGLEPFILNESQRSEVDIDFSLAMSDARLEGKSKHDICRVIPDAYNSVPGVYFWVMGVGPNLYRIYVGKTKSLERRLADYIRDFQAHSPNDYKVRIFQQAIIAREPAAYFTLYFAQAALDTYTQLEKKFIQRYKPLLNRPASVGPAARKSFQEGCVEFYRAGF